MAAWSSAYEAEPQQSDSPSEGDDAIRSLKEEIRERMENEHTAYTTTGSLGERAKDFIHRPGSARAYYRNTEPTTLPNGNALTSETDITKGTIWINSDTNAAKVWTGSEFGSILTDFVTRVGVQGELSTGTEIVPSIIFPSGVQITKVSARVGTTSEGSGIRVDFNKNGLTSIFSTTTYIEIAEGSASATITSSALSVTHSVLSADDYLTMDIDQVGSTEAGANLSVAIIGVIQ